ncbi:MAG: hypothetical protein ACPG6B_08765 [Oceanihabitans sp.]
MATPNGIITAAEAVQLNNDWTTYRKTANDSVAAKGEDNRSSWFSIQDLEDFLTLVKKSHSDATGIRMYLGVHDVVKGDGGKTTVFMVPTKKAGEGVNQDIPNAKGLNKGVDGNPPGAGYPQ